MDNLQGHPGPFPDLEGLIQRLEQCLSLPPEVDIVYTAVLCDDLSQLGELIGIRVAAGGGDQARGHATGPILQRSGNQVSHLIGEIEKRVKARERTLVTTLTKRMAEELSDYITKKGFRCRYLHSEINTLERIEILRDLRNGEFDVLVGINLLREGLDLPEVSAVAILDADKEGFLRSKTSLVQTIGRTARNINASVFLYADTVTESMQKAIDETNRRRKIQLKYNKEHNITPQTIRKEIRKTLTDQVKARQTAQKAVRFEAEEFEKTEMVSQIEKEMLDAAQNLDFERAAFLRDQLRDFKEIPKLIVTSKIKKEQKKKERKHEKTKHRKSSTNNKNGD